MYLNMPNKQPLEISIFWSLTDPNSKEMFSIKQVLGMIKAGYENVPNLINNIREGNKDLKTKLPCICWSGAFTSRNKDSIIEPSNIICLDFDKYKSLEELNQAKKILSNNEYVFACFISPSGLGLKVLVKIEGTKNPKTHGKIFDSLFEYFNDDHLDRSGRDLARVCFMSYDSELYYNKDSKVWHYEPKEEVKKVFTKPEVVLPLSEQETVENLLKWWRKDHSAMEGSRNNSIFVLASSFCRAGIDNVLAFSICLSESNGLDAKEVKTCVKSAYKTNIFNSQPLENSEKLKEVYNQIITKKDMLEVAKKNNITLEEVEKIKEASNVVDYQFWTLKPKGGYKIELDLYFDFVYHALNISVSANKDFIKVTDNQAEMIDFYDVIRDTQLWLKRNGIDREIVSAFLDCNKINETKLKSNIHTTAIKTVKDSQYTCRIPFKNGLLEVTKEGSKLKKYSELDFVIWQSSVLDRDFVENKNWFKSDIVRFFENLTKYQNREGGFDGIHYDNLLALQSLFGYMIHRYKGADNNKIVILNDYNTSEEVTREGGIGKGAFCDLISAVRKNKINFDENTIYDDKFWKQSISKETDLIRVDETARKFQINKFYTLVSDDFTVERKNQSPVEITYDEAPRIIIATNYSIPENDPSTARRVHQVQFSNYGRLVEPITELGKINGKTKERRRLVSKEWDKEEWEFFDNFTVFCIMTYLENGLLPFENKELDLKHARTNGLSENLIDYLEDKIIEKNENEIDVVYAYNDFIDLYDMDRKFYKQAKFTRSLKDWAKAFKYNLEIRKIKRLKNSLNDKRYINSKLYIFTKK